MQRQALSLHACTIRPQATSQLIIQPPLCPPCEVLLCPQPPSCCSSGNAPAKKKVVLRSEPACRCSSLFTHKGAVLWTLSNSAGGTTMSWRGMWHCRHSSRGVSAMRSASSHTSPHSPGSSTLQRMQHMSPRMSHVGTCSHAALVGFSVLALLT